MTPAEYLTHRDPWCDYCHAHHEPAPLCPEYAQEYEVNPADENDGERIVAATNRPARKRRPYL